MLNLAYTRRISRLKCIIGLLELYGIVLCGFIEAPPPTSIVSRWIRNDTKVLYSEIVPTVKEKEFYKDYIGT